MEINVARRYANNKSNHILIPTHYIFTAEINLTSTVVHLKLQALLNQDIAVSNSNF